MFPRWTEGTPLKVSCTLSSLGLDHPAGYAATDLFTGVQLGTFKPRCYSNDTEGAVIAIMVIKRSHIHCHYLAHFWHLQMKVMVIMVDIDIDEQLASDISYVFLSFQRHLQQQC